MCFKAFTAGLACGQNYPTKPIRIVTGAVAGSSDLGARLVAQGLAAPLGQSVVVDNRGGSVVIAAEAVARAQPDAPYPHSLRQLEEAISLATPRGKARFG